MIVINMNLQESIKRILKEESVKTELIKMIKDDGINSASSIVGGVNNLMEVMGINNPIRFLNIYNDVEVLKSEKHPTLTLYRYSPKRNIMVYSKDNSVIYVNYDEVFLVFREFFMLDVIQSKEIVRRWATHQFNIPPQVRVEISRGSTLMVTI